MKILVERGYALGDTIMCSCVLKPLREKYPKAEIHYISGFPEALGPAYPYAKIMREPKYKVEEYDLRFDLGRQSLIEGNIPYHSPLIHIACAACGVRFNEPEIPGEALETDFTVGIIPKTGRVDDTWGPEQFQELIDMLDKDGFKCISMGPKDAPRFKNCYNEYPEWEKERVNDWGYGADKMNKHVYYTARIMKGLGVVVTGDTGLFHVAAACQTPTVLILPAGSSEHDFWPQTRHHITVRSTTNKVADIDVRSVYNATCRLLFEAGKMKYGKQHKRKTN